MMARKQAKTKAPLRVFLSHAAVDTVYARKLRKLVVERLGARVFITEDLSAGEGWRSTLRKKLPEADAVVALLTPRGVHSNHVLQELGAAWALEKPIIAVVTRRDVLNSLPIVVESAEISDLDVLQDEESAKQFLDRLEGLIASAHAA